MAKHQQTQNPALRAHFRHYRLSRAVWRKLKTSLETFEEAEEGLQLALTEEGAMGVLPNLRDALRRLVNGPAGEFENGRHAMTPKQSEAFAGILGGLVASAEDPVEAAAFIAMTTLGILHRLGQSDERIMELVRLSVASFPGFDDALQREEQ